MRQLTLWLRFFLNPSNQCHPCSIMLKIVTQNLALRFVGSTKIREVKVYDPRQRITGYCFEISNIQSLLYTLPLTVSSKTY